SAGFHRRVVGDDHAKTATYAPETRDNSGSGSAAIFGVHLVRGPQAKFEKGAAFVEKKVEPLTNGKALFRVLRSGALGASTLPNRLLLRADSAKHFEKRGSIGLGARSLRVERGFDHILKFGSFRHS